MMPVMSDRKDAPRRRDEPVLDAVRAMPMFRGLKEDAQRHVAGLASLREYRRGDHLWRAGDDAAHFTLIVRGRVKVVKEGESTDVIYELFGEGEPVGAIAVYNYMPYPASAVALEPTTLLCLPRRDWFELLDRNPEFARSIIRELTRLVLALTRKLDEMRGQSVETRIAQLFLTLAERIGRDTRHGVELPIRLTRQEVADLVGTTVESAIRVLSRWGRDGVLVTGEQNFVVPSLERLREAAGNGGGSEGTRGPLADPPRN
jgi:CRP/FNR family cyclic AMP-dependent transcriptional regulator